MISFNLPRVLAAQRQYHFDPAVAPAASDDTGVRRPRGRNSAAAAEESLLGDGDPPDKAVWAVQMVVWCIITIVARLFVLVIMLAAEDPLGWVSEKIAYPFRDDPRLFLVLVMIGCPLCMNALQLWIQDTFLRWKEWSQIPVGAEKSPSFKIPSSQRVGM